MDEKMKRKGTPRRLYTKIAYGILLAVLFGVGVLSLLLVKNMNDDAVTPPAIAPLNPALEPNLENLRGLSNAIPPDAEDYLNGTIMVHDDDYYLCLNIPEGVLLSIDLSALNIRINEQTVGYSAKTNAPLNCILLDATLSSGWYIFELQTLDSESRQPTANYIWGIQVP